MVTLINKFGININLLDSNVPFQNVYSYAFKISSDSFNYPNCSYLSICIC